MSRAKIPVTINGLEFDALISSEESYEATVPEYSVEEGFTISDSIVLSPEKLSMVLFITDTPVTWAARHGSYIGKAEADIAKLKEIFFARTPVTIITTDATYVNMAIENFTLSKSSDVGTSREIPISFKKINVTKSETTTIPDSYGKSGATQAAAGTASTTAATTSSASTSSSSSAKSSSSSSSSGKSSSNDSSNKKSSILYSAGKSIGLIK